MFDARCFSRQFTRLVVASGVIILVIPVCLGQARQGRRDVPYDQYNAGLHHLCFRARNEESIEEVTQLVENLGGGIVHGPRKDEWAPGYYSVLFEDPCGTRLEVNYVPGKGNLDKEIELPLSEEVQRKLSTD